MNSQLVGSLFIAIICIYFIYSRNNVYLIGDNSFDILRDIQSHVLDARKEISLISSRYVDNTRIVTFAMGGEFGVAIYSKGYNNKLMLNWIDFGASRCFSRTFSTDKGKYLIAAGDNSDLLIDQVETTINKMKIKLSTKNERYFLKVCTLDHEAVDGMALLKLYSESRGDITRELMYTEGLDYRLDDFAFISNN